MFFTYLLLILRAVHTLARLVKTCLDIYNGWPRKPRYPDDDEGRWPDWR